MIKLMLTPNEEKYLEKIPAGRTASVWPFDPKTREVAKEIIDQINTAIPELEVLHMGATALGIAGQNDLDLYILSSGEKFEKYLSQIEKLFGQRVQGISIYKWEFAKDGFEVELYLADPVYPEMKRQLKVFEILSNDAALLREYEKIKLSSNRAPFRDYMRKKLDNPVPTRCTIRANCTASISCAIVEL
ncbi:MAG: GrpB family protein [bacterium]|nr:GrpB family protein [bacterium]